MACPLQTDNKQCSNCGNYWYDSFYDKEHCTIDGMCPCEYQADGVDCNDWICQYEKWLTSADERSRMLTKQVQELKALYEAEKLLRKAAESEVKDGL
jgi:hypothetical protein